MPSIIPCYLPTWSTVHGVDGVTAGVLEGREALLVPTDQVVEEKSMSLCVCVRVRVCARVCLYTYVPTVRLGVTPLSQRSTAENTKKKHSDSHTL